MHSYLFVVFAILLRPHSDSRIDKAIAQVHNDAGYQTDRGVEGRQQQEEVVVQCGNGIDIQVADAGNNEDILDDQRAAQDADKLADDHRQDGDDGAVDDVDGTEVPDEAGTAGNARADRSGRLLYYVAAR